MGDDVTDVDISYKRRRKDIVSRHLSGVKMVKGEYRIKLALILLNRSLFSAKIVQNCMLRNALSSSTSNFCKSYISISNQDKWTALG